MSSIIILSVYFEKRLPLVAGITACGTGVGIFVFAPIINALLSEYSWKGTLLIEAGIFLNCILFSMSYRPLTATRMLSEDKSGVQTVAEDKCTGEIKPERRKVIIRSWSSPELSQMSPQNVQSQKLSSSPRSSKQLSSLIEGRDELSNRKFDRIEQDPPVYGGYIRITSVEVESPSQPNKYRLPKTGHTEEKRQTVSEIFNFQLFCDVVFALFAVSNLLTAFGLIVPLIFLADRGLHLGFDSSESSWLISVVGITNTVGRIVFGLMANVKFVNRLILYNTALVICGICSLFSVLFWTFPFQACYACVVGLCFGK